MKAPGQDKWVKITETPAAGGTYVDVQASQEFFDIVGREVGKQPQAQSGGLQERDKAAFLNFAAAIKPRAERYVEKAPLYDSLEFEQPIYQ